MKITFSAFMEMAREPLKTLDEKNPQQAGMIALALDGFEAQHEDDAEEEYHVGFLVNELLSSTIDHWEDKFSDESDRVEELENQIEDVKSDLEEISSLVTRLEEKLSD